METIDPSPDDRYNVVLEGRVRAEANRDAVVPDLAALIGRDAGFARELLSGRPVVLRSNVGHDEAAAALAALTRIGVVARIEHAPPLTIDADVDARLFRRARPALWNPNAAANWSLIFTPVFGAYLHRRNWSALGDPARLRSARRWFAASLVVLVATFLLPIVRPQMAGSLPAFNFAFLLVWYFAAARPQARFVKRDLGGDYVRRSWWGPLSIAFVTALLLTWLEGWVEGSFAVVETTRDGATRL